MQSPLLPSAGLTEKLFEELLTELRTERSNMREQHQELVKERKAERRWRTIFQFALIGIPLLGTIAYVISSRPLWDSSGDHSAAWSALCGLMAKSQRRAWHRPSASSLFSRGRSRTPVSK